MDEYRLLNKKWQKEKEEKSPFKKILFRTMSEIMISVILLLVALIVTKNTTLKEKVYQYVYQENLSFKELERTYQKYFGSLFPIPKNPDNNPVDLVSSEKMQYEKTEEIENGIRLIMKKESIVTALESGLVLFIGEKEGYGNTIIVEQIDGCEAWYVGVDGKDLKIYDYVEKQSILGTCKEDSIDLYFKKKGEVVDYKNYVF